MQRNPIFVTFKGEGVLTPCPLLDPRMYIGEECSHANF